MSTKNNPNQKEIEVMAKSLANLVGIFRVGKIARDSRWWQSMDLFNPCYGYQEGQPIFDSIIKGLLKFNPQMLSEHYVRHKLIYELLQMQVIEETEPRHLHGQELINEAEKHLRDLVQFKACQDVDIPIANLWHEGEAVKILGVSFIMASEQDLEKWRSQKVLWSQKAPDVRVIARILAPGDRHKALSYARTRVDLVLDVIRAFCFPFGRYSDTWQVGVVGEIISSASTPMRINNKDFVAYVGPGLAEIDLRKHILSNLLEQQWDLITKLYLKREDARTEMESKLINGIHWLAESTKPDDNNSKFAKICFALETMIGGEPRDEDLKVRGITAMLAERAAFIAGGDFNDRSLIDRNIRRYYGKRSAIVHGGEENASSDDIDQFGQLVRRLALALVERLDKLRQISDVEKLETWVKVQRYTLPDQDKPGGSHVPG